MNKVERGDSWTVDMANKGGVEVYHKKDGGAYESDSTVRAVGGQHSNRPRLILGSCDWAMEAWRWK